jgi:hypothetical protein
MGRNDPFRNCTGIHLQLRVTNSNTKYIFWRPHVDRNFVVLKNKVAVNQDATVVPLFWAANRNLQFVIVA